MNSKQKIYNFLRWSEKYTRTDMVYLAKGGFWLTAEQVVTSLAGIILAIAFANLLPKETYGVYRYVLSLVGILSVFSLTGMNTAIVRTVAQGNEGVLASVLGTRLRWGVLGGVVSLGLAGFYFLNHNITLIFCFLIAAVFLPFMDSLTIYESFWEGKKLFRMRASYNILVRVAAVIILVITLILTKNLVLILLAYFCSYTFLRLICFLATLKKSFSHHKDLETISYGKHLSIMNIMGMVSAQADKVLLWYFLGPVSLASYVLALAPVDNIGSLFKNLFPLSLPKFSEQPLKAIQATLFKKITKLFLMIIPLGGLYIILAPWIFKFFFPAYTEAIPYSQFYIIAILIMIPQVPLGAVLAAKMRKKELYIVKFTSPLAEIFLLLILLPLYGIWGAIMSAIFTQVINFALLLFLLKRME